MRRIIGTSTVWRYVFKEVFSPTLLGLGVYVLVFLMNALFELAELAIKKDLTMGTVVTILLFYLPRVLVMTIPMAILLGVLVGVGRLSSDSEVIALRASGVSYWKILGPVLALGAAGWALGSLLILVIEPKANYSRRQVTNRLMYSADLRREIKPRVFFEEIPGMLLYADEVHQGGDFLDRIFIYQSEDAGRELVTLARRAQIDYERNTGVARFYLEEGTSHTTTPTDAESYQVSRFQRQMIVKGPDESFRIKSGLLTRPAPKNYREQDLQDLMHSILKAGAITDEETRNRVIGHILTVVHERFALPVACLVFAVLGVPLGVMNRRGGRASGFSLSIAIAIVYWILLSAGENLVSQGRLSPYVGLWIGNASLAILGIILFFLLEKSEGLQLSVLVPVRLQRALQALRRREEMEQDAKRRHDMPGPTWQEKPGRLEARGREAKPKSRAGRRATLRPVPPAVAAQSAAGNPEEIDLGEMEEAPGKRMTRTVRASIIGAVVVIAGLASLSFSPFLLVGLVMLALLLVYSTTMDRYILSRFGSILAGCLLTVFALFAVYEFIQLIDDLVERDLPFSMALDYLKYRSPWILSQILPMSCLVSTFLAFGIMSRFNEVTASKAGGTSIYRLAAPVVIVTVAISAVAYVNQDYLIPPANQRATQIKDRIRGRSPRSYLARERRWVFGEGGRLYNFRNYIPSHLPVLGRAGGGEFQGFSAYLLDPSSYEIQERVYARSAAFEGDHWNLSDGWVREFREGRESFETFVERRFDFPEASSYFIKEWKSPEQMTYSQLKTFVRDLRRRGYDVQELMVDLHDKTALPLVSLTIVVLGLPFCFRMGRRGSLYGIGVAVILVGLFLLTFSATNALGGIGLIPPFLAAWAPNILFAGSGVYLLLRTGT
jgi:LPS export ABC transporter permease LptG/LPS export ABC transporter permease LptF